MMRRTALPLLVPLFSGWCPCCRPIPGSPFHKAACAFRPLGDWSASPDQSEDADTRSATDKLATVSDKREVKS